METKLTVILCVVLIACIPQTLGDNSYGEEDMTKFANMAADFFQSQGRLSLQNAMRGIVGNSFSGPISTGYGDNAGNTGNAGNGPEPGNGVNPGSPVVEINEISDIIKGFGSLMDQHGKDGGADVLSGLAGMFIESLDPKKKNDIGGDLFSIVPTFLSALSQGGNAEVLEKLSEYVPWVIDFVKAITGPEAQEREAKHAEHSWAFPPLLERLHIFADHFMNSAFGKRFVASVGAEKIIKIFSDEKGNFSYDKFVELMENHSFRRHWIQMVILRIAKFVEYHSDPKSYEAYIGTVQFLVNGFLTSQGVPKSSLLNASAPLQSLSALTDYLLEKYLGFRITTRKYVEPIGTYLMYVLDTIRQLGAAKGGTEGIAEKLADSINLEIIEPIARVNRAYRFLKKHPKCDRYVLCLVNQQDNSRNTIPGLKMVLGKGTSFVASWVLSSLSGTSMLEYFNLILYEENCQKYYKSDCSNYHEAEVKVTTGYIHNEL